MRTLTQATMKCEGPHPTWVRPSATITPIAGRPNAPLPRGRWLPHHMYATTLKTASIDSTRKSASENGSRKTPLKSRWSNFRCM